ncbi:Glucanosyltransferase-domain-containing protein [Hyaloscypha finlandica]|nr:Glucanosyltransferase-domain-containing protein [Hyaloscypha finlandica]
MKSFGVASIAAAAFSGALFAISVTAALPPIVIKGSHFFFENGTEFFIRGVAYQQDVNSNGSTSTTGSFTDPLADSAGCSRDIPLLQELGTNTIRVYAINASLDHSACMQMLQDAGIYLIQDLSNPSSSINRNDPTWTTELFADYAAVVDAMANYTNVLGFFAGNEVSNDVSNTNASAFVKAAVRDMKSYIKTKGYRTIGVGYATNDNADIRIDLANYFNCGDAADAIDFWGYNIYSWCGDSSYTESGYDQRTAEFANYSVPAFFAEYGCNQVQPRQFTEVQAIYGKNMTGVWSGGIVYMYFQETNDFGLVTVSGDTVTKLADFTALSKQLALATPSSTNSANYVVTNTAAQACPATGANWAAASALPPIANADVCTCMVTSLSCVAETGLSDNTTASLFSTVCGLDKTACAGINTNGTTGVYGAYSMCNSYQKLSFSLDQYYKNQNKASTACNFNGQAKTQSGSTSSSCSSLLNQAGSAGTGTVTTAPTGTGASSSSGTSTKKSAAGTVIIPRLDMGLLQLSIYLFVAGIAGGGMILL